MCSNFSSYNYWKHFFDLFLRGLLEGKIFFSNEMFVGKNLKMAVVPEGLPMSEICFKRIPIFHIFTPRYCFARNFVIKQYFLQL